MKNVLLVTAIMVSVVFTGCDLKKTESGELPTVDVDVDAEDGDLPSYDVDWASVDVGTNTKTVEVPKLIVVTEEEQVEVPTIDFDMPGEENERRDIVVQAEVSDTEHKLEIQQIRASQRRLFVIATLTKMDQSLDGKTMRVQDQVELNAPDVDVKYIVVGEKPDRVFNDQYMYVNTMDDLNDVVKNAHVIYNK